MTSTNEKGLASERVQHPTDIDLNDLHCSTICENVLWKPVSCQQCETHFCTSCINKWLLKNPHQCPLRCDSFIQRPCSRFIAKQLAKLQITCIYESNGCNKVSIAIVFFSRIYHRILFLLGYSIRSIRKA